jgi:hypothetical protein
MYQKVNPTKIETLGPSKDGPITVAIGLDRSPNQDFREWFRTVPTGFRGTLNVRPEICTVESDRITIPLTTKDYVKDAERLLPEFIKQANQWAERKQAERERARTR